MGLRFWRRKSLHCWILLLIGKAACGCSYLRRIDSCITQLKAQGLSEPVSSIKKEKQHFSEGDVVFHAESTRMIRYQYRFGTQCRYGEDSDETSIDIWWSYGVGSLFERGAFVQDAPHLLTSSGRKLSTNCSSPILYDPQRDHLLRTGRCF